MGLTTPECAIYVNDILQYVPHRPPMVWVDRVVSFDDDDGECLLELKAEGLYMGERGLRPSSCIEFIAQASGFITICYNVYCINSNSKTIKKAFLAAVKDAKYADEAAFANCQPGDKIQIFIHRSRVMGQISIIDGRVLKDGQLLCECQLKVFKET